MAHRVTAALVAAFIGLQSLPSQAFADNQMGYELLTPTQASNLPHNGGKLGMGVGRGKEISSGGMTFDLLRVNKVTQGSAGEQAGLRVGDQIIAVDGHVFPDVATFAAYVDSNQPGHRISIDYMPSGSGPQDAQRVAVTLGAGGRTAAPVPSPQDNGADSKGLSTGTKIAIGAGAAALLCYKFHCLSRLRNGGALPQR